jgi:hypothetical protein
MFQVNDLSAWLSTQVYTSFGRSAGGESFFFFFSQVRADEFRKVGCKVGSTIARTTQLTGRTGRPGSWPLLLTPAARYWNWLTGPSRPGLWPLVLD